MNKDTIVASVIGFSLGLVAAIALWIVPRFLHKSPDTTSKVADTNQEIVLETQKNTETLTVAQPVDGVIVNSEDLTVQGTASDALYVVVTTDSSNDVIEPEANGTFSADVTLHDGSNEIAVTRYTENGEETKSVFVYYYEEII